MDQVTYKSFDELPMFLNVATVSKVLGISNSSGYVLMHEKDFPSIKIGSRILVPRDKFKDWLDVQCSTDICRK
jgi:excisionase family DNA binding protein